MSRSTFAMMEGLENRVALKWRSVAGQKPVTITITGVTAPRWVKIVRTGNSFAGYYSSDGAKWTQIGTGQTLQVDPTGLVGLAVTSHTTSLLDTATFSNVSIS